MSSKQINVYQITPSAVSDEYLRIFEYIGQKYLFGHSKQIDVHQIAPSAVSDGDMRGSNQSSAGYFPQPILIGGYLDLINV